MVEFLEDMHEMARHLEMKIVSYAEIPVAPVDFKLILRRLMNNSRNQAMV